MSCFQIVTATNKNKESEDVLADLRQSYLRSQNEMHDQLVSGKCTIKIYKFLGYLWEKTFDTWWMKNCVVCCDVLHNVRGMCT